MSAISLFWPNSVILQSTPWKCPPRNRRQSPATFAHNDTTVSWPQSNPFFYCLFVSFQTISPPPPPPPISLTNPLQFLVYHRDCSLVMDYLFPPTKKATQTHHTNIIADCIATSMLPECFYFNKECWWWWLWWTPQRQICYKLKSTKPK